VRVYDAPHCIRKVKKIFCVLCYTENKKASSFLLYLKKLPPEDRFFSSALIVSQDKLSPDHLAAVNFRKVKGNLQSLLYLHLAIFPIVLKKLSV
jgi:hypothetical protein